MVELLFVLAIIGILAGFILSSLNDARTSGIDAKIQTEMDALSKRAEIEHARFFTYDLVCGSNGVATSSVIFDILTSINGMASSSATCNSSPGDYAVSVPIGGGHWCVDNTGSRKEIPATLAPGQFSCL